MESEKDLLIFKTQIKHMMAFGEDLNDVLVPLSDTEDDKVVKDILNCKEVKLAVGSEVLAIVNNVSVSRDRG